MKTMIKAIAGATAAGIGATGTAAITVPPEVAMRWWGYLVVGVVNAGIVFTGVYLAPKNVEPGAAA